MVSEEEERLSGLVEQLEKELKYKGKNTENIIYVISLCNILT